MPCVPCSTALVKRLTLAWEHACDVNVQAKLQRKYSSVEVSDMKMVQCCVYVLCDGSTDYLLEPLCFCLLAPSVSVLPDIRIL